MAIGLEQMVRALYPEFDPTRVKLHLAQWDGHEDPLEVFRAGLFDVWQGDQTKRNFQRAEVLALIQTHLPETWLFAGLWRRAGEPVQGRERWDPAGRRPVRDDLWVYDLDPVPQVEDLVGRLHCHYRKDSRANYRNLETCLGEISVSTLVEQPRTVPRFEGYRHVHLSMAALQRLVAAPPEDWRSALSAVAGVYLITGADGAQYVGSASGVEGIWGRWREYAQAGHGDNVRLRAYVERHGAGGLRFAILETADNRTTRAEILGREYAWMRVLGSRAHGLNSPYHEPG